jgi:ABC-type oligopeptide transport system substrate-binding subunit
MLRFGKRKIMKTNFTLLLIFFLITLSCSKDKIGNLYPKDESTHPDSLEPDTMDMYPDGLEETPITDSSVYEVDSVMDTNR